MNTKYTVQWQNSDTGITTNEIECYLQVQKYCNEHNFQDPCGELLLNFFTFILKSSILLHSCAVFSKQFQTTGPLKKRRFSPNSKFFLGTAINSLSVSILQSWRNLHAPVPNLLMVINLLHINFWRVSSTHELLHRETYTLLKFFIIFVWKKRIFLQLHFGLLKRLNVWNYMHWK